MKKLLFLVPTYSSFYKPIKSAFERNGWEVETVDYRRGDLITRATRLIARLGSINTDFLIEKKIIRASAEIKPNLILTIKGETLTKDLLKKLKTKKNKIINWFPDPMLLFKLADEIAPSYDYFFHYDSGIAKKLKQKGHKNIHYLPFAAEIAGGKQNKVYDVSFVGTYSKHREKILSSLTKLDLNIWGDPRWKRSSLSGFARGGRISQPKMKKIIKSTKININIHNETNINGINLRIFEVLGCGEFLLSDYTKDLDNLFEVGKDLITYKNIIDLKNKVNYFLNNKKKRIEIALNGQKKVKNIHTYEKRVSQIINLLT